MDSLTADGVMALFQSEYKTTPTTDVFNETYDQLCQVHVTVMQRIHVHVHVHECSVTIYLVLFLRVLSSFLKPRDLVICHRFLSMEPSSVWTQSVNEC